MASDNLHRSLRVSTGIVRHPLARGLKLLSWREPSFRGHPNILLALRLLVYGLNLVAA